MARVRLNRTEEIPEEHREMFERMDRDGTNLNIYRALSHSPAALRRFMRFGRYLLFEGALDPLLREIAILRAGWLCRSPYEFSQHVAFGRLAGLTDDQIRAIASPVPDASLFDERQAAVLAFAAELTADARVSDAAWAAAAGFLDEEQMVELVLVTGFYNMISRALNALQVDIDPPAARDLIEIGVKLPADG
jgi:alkylhydroperoxidase family enzyme